MSSSTKTSIHPKITEIKMEIKIKANKNYKT